MSIINEALRKAQEDRKQQQQDERRPGFEPSLRADAARGKERDFSEKSAAPVRAGNKYLFFVITVIVIAVVVFMKWFPPFSIRDITIPEISIYKKAVIGAPQAQRAADLPSVSPVPSILKTTAFPSLSLNGIVYDEEKPYAIVNDRILVKGDTIEGATLIKISRDGIKLSFNGEEFEVNSK